MYHSQAILIWPNILLNQENIFTQISCNFTLLGDGGYFIMLAANIC